MAKRLRFIRHDTATADAFVGREGELTVDLGNDEVRVHDGVKAGGHGAARKDLANVLAATASRDGKMTQAQVISLTNVIANLASEIANRIADVDAEEAARIAADSALEAAYIAADGVVTAAYQAADTALSNLISTNASDIAAEILARTNADSSLASDISTLDSALTSEISTRSSADTTLTNSLNAFIAQKAAASGLASLNSSSQVIQKALSAFAADSATTAGSCSGNAATASALFTARTIGGVSFDGSANINLPGVNQSGTQNTSGNAATATAFNSSRTIELTGAVTGSQSSADGAHSIATSLAANAVGSSEFNTNPVTSSVFAVAASNSYLVPAGVYQLSALGFNGSITIYANGAWRSLPSPFGGVLISNGSNVSINGGDPGDSTFYVYYHKF